MRFFLKYVALLIMAFFFVSSVFALERPEVELKAVTDQMLSALKRENQSIKNNPQRLVLIIEKILIPHVDVYDMSRWVVGRNAWLKATPTQQAQFSKEFKNLLIRTYASNLTAYNDQVIEYLPVKEEEAKKSRVLVATLIEQAGRNPIHVSYRLRNSGGKWMLYDINVEGVSLLAGFKAQFQSDIQQFGINSVIDKMQTHNDKPIALNIDYNTR